MSSDRRTQDAATSPAPAGASEAVESPGPSDAVAVTDTTSDAIDVATLDRSATVGAARARQILDVVERDWRWLVQRGVVEVVKTIRNPYGAGRIGLYLVGDLLNLIARPDGHVRGCEPVTWAQVRAVPVGRASALAVPGLRPARRPSPGERVAAWHRGPGAAWVDLEVAYVPRSHRWVVDLPITADPEDMARLRSELAAVGLRDGVDLVVGRRSRDLTRWARTALRDGAAVVLDTETTGLYDADVVELGVVDATTGDVLLQTLVRPTVGVEPEARAVHGITDADLLGAPTLADVLPRLRAAVAGRRIWAYNAPFDAGVLASHAAHEHLDGLGDLLDPERWECLMDAYATWLGSSRWVPLGGAHRAVGDALAARTVAYEIARSPLPAEDSLPRLRAHLSARRAALLAQDADSVAGLVVAS